MVSKRHYLLALPYAMGPFLWATVVCAMRISEQFLPVFLGEYNRFLYISRIRWISRNADVLVMAFDSQGPAQTKLREDFFPISGHAL